MKFSKYLNENLISYLEAKDRDEALKILVETLSKNGMLQDKKVYYRALLEREKIVSTGIGMGVAIPHAKLKECNNFFIAIGIQRETGLDWDALDKAPVKLIFMIGGPDNRQTEYLQILSRLTSVIKHEETRKKMLKTNNLSEILHLFENI